MAAASGARISPTCGCCGGCCATSQHRNHSPLLTILHWHYVRSGELFSIIPLSGLADHVVNGGFPFDLPALKPFFCGPDGYLPRAGGFSVLRRLPGCPHPL